MAISVNTPGDLDTRQWADRRRVGTRTEQHFVDQMQNKGYTCCMVSQHRDNPQNALARHFPDIFVVELSVFVQIKWAGVPTDWSTVIGQKASIDAARELQRQGSDVWVIWEMPDDIFKGNSPDKLKITGSISDRARRRGSGTPAYRIAKSCLRPLNDLIQARREDINAAARSARF